MTKYFYNIIYLMLVITVISLVFYWGPVQIFEGLFFVVLLIFSVIPLGILIVVFVKRRMIFNDIFIILLFMVNIYFLPKVIAYHTNSKLLAQSVDAFGSLDWPSDDYIQKMEYWAAKDDSLAALGPARKELEITKHVTSKLNWYMKNLPFYYLLNNNDYVYNNYFYDYDYYEHLRNKAKLGYYILCVLYVVVGFVLYRTILDEFVKDYDKSS